MSNDATLVAVKNIAFIDVVETFTEPQAKRFLINLLTRVWMAHATADALLRITNPEHIVWDNPLHKARTMIGGIMPAAMFNAYQLHALTAVTVHDTEHVRHMWMRVLAETYDSMLAVRKDVFKDLLSQLWPWCYIASETMRIPLEEIERE